MILHNNITRKENAMQSIRDQKVTVENLTEGNGHYFFGYYDVAAFDADGKYHLYHKVGFMDRLPAKDDVAELGMIEVATGKTIKIAETTAWNFQQGAMFQWNPARPDREVVYNVLGSNAYQAVIKDVRTGKERVLEMPIAAIDPKGRYALSINFSRVFDFRPGYGYAGVEDANGNNNAPVNDGIFLVDMTTGKGRLVMSLQQTNDLLCNTRSVVKNGKLVINHISFNTTGSRFVALIRNTPAPGKPWGTALITADADGNNAYVLSDYTMSSHYHWRDESQLLIYAEHREGNQLYLLRDKSQEYKTIDKDFFKADGHCSYSPDRKLILYDSYPRDKYRHLFVYDAAGHKGSDLASFYSDPVSTGDIRCDLHPRWHPDGRMVSFDSTHEGRRHIYIARLA